MQYRPFGTVEGPSSKWMRPVTLVLLLSLICIASVILPNAAAADDDDSGHDYHNNEWTFLIISFTMTYGAAAILVSIFTLKYGQKKARFVAVPMLMSGLAIWGIWIYFKFIIQATYPDDTIFGIIYWSTAPLLKPIMAVIGMALGGGLALFVFLTLVVRS